MFRKHLIITFEMLSINLYEFIKMNNFNGFSLNLIKRFAIQILISLFFMKENNIANRRDLSPDHARAVLKAVAESQDPRILSYRNFIRLMQLFPWLRSGARGTE